ncbi:uncharacterized protein LOC129229747 [Uloborus diversus]|uniref:uncharacterized protein LOC129229747 n=1 Tax=Uloborus diversus TaxID=327109 RepID=UPI00240A8174|nr:uncharacterized protein LOC129229747 [Uloborus diversus]
MLMMSFSVMHIGAFAYWSTHVNDKISMTVAPFYVANCREVFYLFLNFYTLVDTIIVLATSLFSKRSNTALLASLYLFGFNLIQALLLSCASASLFLLYQDEEVQKVYADTLSARTVLAATGILLAGIHAFSALYDLRMFFRRKSASRRSERSSSPANQSPRTSSPPGNRPQPSSSPPNVPKSS